MTFIIVAKFVELLVVKEENFVIKDFINFISYSITSIDWIIITKNYLVEIYSLKDLYLHLMMKKNVEIQIFLATNY